MSETDCESIRLNSKKGQGHDGSFQAFGFTLERSKGAGLGYILTWF